MHVVLAGCTREYDWWEGGGWEMGRRWMGMGARKLTAERRFVWVLYVLGPLLLPEEPCHSGVRPGGYLFMIEGRETRMVE